MVVAAIGNVNDKNKSPRYPAAYPGVLAVGGIDRNGRRAEFSVTGPEVMIMAPAVDITSPAPGGGYTVSKGTSDATAIVSGAAALVRARFPELSAPEVIRRLTLTADDAGPPGRDVEYGFGILNIVRALTEELPPPENTAAPPPPAQAGDAGTTVSSGLAAVGILVLFALIVGTVWTINHRRSTHHGAAASND